MKLHRPISKILPAIFSLAFATAMPIGINASEPFVGTLTFEISDGKLTTPVRYITDGERLRIEMGSETMPSRIWLFGVEDIEGVLALSPFKKTYTIEQDGLILPNRRPDQKSGKPRKEELTNLPEPKPAELMGLDCLYFELDSEGPKTKIWILPEALPVPLTVFGVSPGFIDAAPVVAMAVRAHKGIPVKVERRNWRGKALFKLDLTEVDANTPDRSRFEMPEGYTRGGAATRLRKDKYENFRR